MNKKVLLAAALPMLIAACSNEEFTSEGVVGQDKLGKLIEAPLLGGGVEANAPGTRVYDKAGWTWIPATDGTAITGVNSIGLCWTGVNNNPDGYKGPASETGDMVYTNVQFDHAGWLYTGETDVKLHCGALNNGEFHNFVVKDKPQATADYSIPSWSTLVSGKTLDMGQGVFKSQNGTIYEGEYIVYSPYNPSFWNAPVTAKQERLLDLTSNASGAVVNPFELANKYAFNVGYMPTIKGGDGAANFSTRLLTSGIKLDLTAAVDTEIREIVLWSKGEKKFITSQALSAAKIKAAWPNLTEDVYMGTEDEYRDASSTMVVRTSDMVVKSSQPATIYIPFLPEQIADLQILIVNKAGETAVLSNWATGLNFEAGKFKKLALSFNSNGVVYKQNAAVPFSKKNYAYDNNSFLAAYTQANAGSTKEARTVVMLDDIELTSENDVYSAGKQTIYVESDPTFAATDKNVLTLGGNKLATKNYRFNTTNFDVDITTNPMGCCNNGIVNLALEASDTEENTVLTVNGGELQLLYTCQLDGDVKSVFEPKDEEGNLHNDRKPTVFIGDPNVTDAAVTATANFLNEGKMIVAAGTEKGMFTLNGAALKNTGSINVNGNGNTGQDGVIKMVNNATLTNNGDIENHGNIDNNSGKETFTNEPDATFTDYVGSSLSGYRIVNKGNAEFICEVNSEVRYNNAIDLQGIRPTTIVRFVYGEAVNIGTGTFTKVYTLQPQSGKDGIYVPYNESQLVKFESAIDNNTNGTANELVLNNAVDTQNEPIATIIGDFTTTSGKITFNHKALTIDGNYEADGALNTQMPVGIAKITGDMILTNVEAKDGTQGNVDLHAGQSLNVEGDITVVSVAGKVTFANNSKVSASNMSVASGQRVVFEKNNVTYLGKGDTSNGVLTNEGTINIVNAVSGSDVAAKVWCNERAGDGTYLNNSYPQYY